MMSGVVMVVMILRMGWRGLVWISMRVLQLRDVAGILRSGRVGIGNLIGVLIIGKGTGVGKGLVIDIDVTIDINSHPYLREQNNEESSSHHYVPCNSYL